MTNAYEADKKVTITHHQFPLFEGNTHPIYREYFRNFKRDPAFQVRQDGEKMRRFKRRGR
jgi:hypothetical protein